MTHDSPENPEQVTAVVPAETRALVQSAGQEPSPPKELSEDEAAELKARSAEIVRQLEGVEGSREMELLDSLTAVGLQTQKQAGSKLELLRVRVGEMLANEGAAGQVTQDLTDLRIALNKINPNEVGRSGLMRFLSLLPFYNRLSNLIERIAIRYEEVSEQAVVIEKRLREGQTMLRRDNIELRQLYEDVEEQQVAVEKNAYFGELLMKEVHDLRARSTEPRKQDILQNVIYDVAMRVQDLRTMQEVNNQFFVSIEMTRENNTRLGQAVDRTLTLATNTLMVGLAIQSALARQKRVLEATQKTREFLGEMIAANAAAIRQHTEEIGDVYKNPVIALDKLTQAHNDLVQALDTADRLKTEGIEAARQNIVKLRELSTELEEKRGTAGEPAREAASLEA